MNDWPGGKPQRATQKVWLVVDRQPDFLCFNHLFRHRRSYRCRRQHWLHAASSSRPCTFSPSRRTSWWSYTWTLRRTASRDDDWNPVRNDSATDGSQPL